MLEELRDDRACTSRIESVGGCDTSPCLFQSTIFVVLWTEQRCRPTIHTFVQHLRFHTCEHSSLARVPNLRRQCFCYLLPICFNLPVRTHPQGKGIWWWDRMDPICRRELTVFVWSGHCLSPYTPLHRNEVSSLFTFSVDYEPISAVFYAVQEILNVPIVDLDSTRITQNVVNSQQQTLMSYPVII